MSLFKTREFWTTQIEEDECFDQNSMIVTCLNGDSDYIITGSQSGVLRIFKPSSEINNNEITGFVPTDLVIEKIFEEPILQLGCGRLVSGSLVFQTAVLNPRLLSVHLLKIKGGVTEHDIIPYLKGEKNKQRENMVLQKKIMPLWVYNLGEAIIDISVIDDGANKINYIMILGERNLFCLFDSGRLNFMKKLEYSPICFGVYTISEKVFSLVVSETSNLLIYENTTLKWSAKLQFLPICIRRAFLRNIKGALVLLSEEGRLECSYLGTEPNLFVAPPLQERELDLEKVEEELKRLNQMIKETYGNDVKLTSQNADKEITIKIHTNQNLEPCIFDTNLKEVQNSQMCPINIEVLFQMAFEEVQISLAVSEPLKVQPSSQFFNTPEEPISFTCHVYLNENLEIPSLLLNVVVTAVTSLGVPRSFNKSSMLPLRLVAEACPAQKEGEHKITLSVNQNVVPLLMLFPEFAEDTKTTSAIAFKNASSIGQPVTILLAKSSDRYRIQSSSFASLSLIIEQMIYRLNKHYSNNDDFKVSFNSSLPSAEVVSYVKEHFIRRKLVFELEDSLEQLSAQFRIIQKRLLVKLKVYNTTPLTNLEFLLNDTYTEIVETVNKLQEANKELHKAQVELTCVLNLIGNLIKIKHIDENLKELLVSVFCPSVQDINSQYWEDTMDSTLCYLLRTTLAKSEKDKLRISQTNSETNIDISKIEKHLVQVLERISKIESASTSEQIEDDLHEESTNEELEKEDKPVGTQFGEDSMRLMSARKSLLRKRHKNDDNKE